MRQTRRYTLNMLQSCCYKQNSFTDNDVDLTFYRQTLNNSIFKCNSLVTIHTYICSCKIISTRIFFIPSCTEYCSIAIGSTWILSRLNLIPLYYHDSTHYHPPLITALVWAMTDTKSFGLYYRLLSYLCLLHSILSTVITVVQPLIFQIAAWLRRTML